MRRLISRLIVVSACAGLALASMPGCDSGSGGVTQTEQSPAEKQSISKYEQEITKNKAAAADAKKK